MYAIFDRSGSESDEVVLLFPSVASLLVAERIGALNVGCRRMREFIWHVSLLTKSTFITNKFIQLQFQRCIFVFRS
jgi:hypothetical protein